MGAINSLTSGTPNRLLRVNGGGGGGGGGGGSTNLAPVSSFTFSCNKANCSFNASGSTDPDGSIVSYAWNWGDGTVSTNSTSSSPLASHTYSAKGNYSMNVTLTVTDNGGKSTPSTKSVAIRNRK
jgi:PKD repeat protein